MIIATSIAIIAKGETLVIMISAPWFVYYLGTIKPNDQMIIRKTKYGVINSQLMNNQNCGPDVSILAGPLSKAEILPFCL